MKASRKLPAVVKAWFPSLIFIVLVFLLIHGSLRLSRDSMIFPWVVGVVCLALLASEMIKDVKKAAREEAQEKGDSAYSRSMLPSLIWLVAVLPILYLLGYFVTIPLYTFVSLKLFHERWHTCLLLTALVVILFYVIFVVALEVPFYTGIVFSWILD